MTTSNQPWIQKGKDVELPLRSVFLRTGYNYDRNAASKRTGLACDDKSRTVQSDKEASDINVIGRQYGITGLMPQGMRLPMYGDYDQIFDYQTAQNALRDAQQGFMALNSQLRERFNNDPAKFLEFCSTEENRAEMEKLGFIDPNKIRKTEPPPEPKKD